MCYICRQRCPLKSSVVLLATCVMCTGGTINKSVGEGWIVFKVPSLFFFVEHPFVSEDVHRAGGACHPGCHPLSPSVSNICRSTSHTPLNHASFASCLI